MVLLSKEQKQVALKCASRLGIRINNIDFLFKALVHSSYANEIGNVEWQNERLEFLGDSILGFAITLLLYNLFPKANEGDLTLYKSELVSAKTLSIVARELELEHYIYLGKGERSRKENIPVSILASAYEAVIGAVFLDLGYKQTIKMIKNHFLLHIKHVTTIRKQDPKSFLQEYLHKLYKSAPSYRVVKTEGLPHDRTFYVKVICQNKIIGQGRGNSKREAEQCAAQSAIVNLEKGDKLEDKVTL